MLLVLAYVAVAAIPGREWEIVVKDLVTEEAKTYQTTKGRAWTWGEASCMAQPQETTVSEGLATQFVEFGCAYETGKKKLFTVRAFSSDCMWDTTGPSAPRDPINHFDGTGVFFVHLDSANPKAGGYRISTRCLK